MKKGCIFDLDGTLLDTLTSISSCANRALRDHAMPEIPKERYKVLVGDGTAVLIRRMLKETGGPEALFDAVFRTYKEYFKEDCMYQVTPYEGITELITDLKQQHIALAVLSNKPHEQTTRMIREVFGRNTFDMILGQRDGMARKPSPDGVYEIMDQLSLKKEEVLYFGDTNTDMQTAKNAGVESVGVLWGFREERELIENGADHIINHPLNALQLISVGEDSTSIGGD